MKTCYYEQLGVDRKATDDEIKKAYKKMALKYHPDKNREVDTKEIFQNLIEAYEVLSDPNERAWYDSHREQILKGTGGDEMTKEEMEQATYGFNIWPFFSHSCYKGFEETTEKNFYAVYAEVFDKLKQDEYKAYRIQEEFGDEDELQEYVTPPEFGNNKTDLDKVYSFYKHWGSFTTYKTFSWCDAYNVNEAPNRWVKRQMDKENKKERLNEKKQYLKTIRELVEFCKRRDPRWKEYLDYQRNSDDKKREEIKLKIEELKRQREQQNIDDAKNTEDFFCEICCKGYKSEAQLINHNSSKDHKKQMKELLEEVGLSHDKDAFFEETDGKKPKTKHIKPTMSKGKLNKKKRTQQGLSNQNIDDESEDESVEGDESGEKEQPIKQQVQPTLDENGNVIKSQNALKKAAKRAKKEAQKNNGEPTEFEKYLQQIEEKQPEPKKKGKKGPKDIVENNEEVVQEDQNQDVINQQEEEERVKEKEEADAEEKKKKMSKNVKKNLNKRLAKEAELQKLNSLLGKGKKGKGGKSQDSKQVDSDDEELAEFEMSLFTKNNANNDDEDEDEEDDEEEKSKNGVDNGWASVKFATKKEEAKYLHDLTKKKKEEERQQKLKQKNEEMLKRVYLESLMSKNKSQQSDSGNNSEDEENEWDADLSKSTKNLKKEEPVQEDQGWTELSKGKNKKDNKKEKKN